MYVCMYACMHVCMYSFKVLPRALNLGAIAAGQGATMVEHW